MPALSNELSSFGTVGSFLLIPAIKAAARTDNLAPVVRYRFMRIVRISDPGTVVMDLQDEIRRSEDSRYHHRLHGVLLVAQGLNCCQAADLLGDAPRTVAYWVERYQEKGLAGLQEKSRSGRPKKLNAGQLADLQRVIRGGAPSEMGLAGNLWDGKTISAYLREKHGVELSARQCRRLLRQWKLRSSKLGRVDLTHQCAKKPADS